MDKINSFEFCGKTIFFSDDNIKNIQYELDCFPEGEAESVDEEGNHYLARVIYKAGEWQPVYVEPMTPIHFETPIRDEDYGTPFQKTKLLGVHHWERKGDIL